MKESEIIIAIRLDQLHVSKLNTRQPKASHPDVKELAESMRANGQTTPAIVRPFAGKKGHYEIAAGARRRVAAGVAKKETLDCVIRDIPDQEFEELIIIENLQRKNPDPKAEAQTLARIVEREQKEGKSTNIGGLASRLGKSPSWVARRLKLLEVLPALRKEWEDGGLSHFSIEMMEFLGSLPKAIQKEFADAFAGHGCWHLTECDNYTALKNLIEQDYSCRLDTAPFPLDDPDFHGECGANGCSSNSDDSPHLFDFADDKGKDCARCLNSSCFLSRLQKFRTHQLAKVEKGEDDLIYFTKNYQQEVTREDGTVIKTHCEWELGSRYGLELGKKSDEGSRRAIDLTNPDKPKSVYLSPLPRTESSSSAETILQDKEELKRDRHQARRWVKVHEELCEVIREAPLSDLKPDLFKTVAFFGLSYSRSHLEKDEWKLFDDSEKPQKFDRYSNQKTTLEEYAWNGLKSIFISRMTFNRVIDCLKVVPEMERITQLIGFDLAESKKQADKDLPPPKSWGKVDPHTLLAA